MNAKRLRHLILNIVYLGTARCRVWHAGLTQPRHAHAKPLHVLSSMCGGKLRVERVVGQSRGLLDYILFVWQHVSENNLVSCHYQDVFLQQKQKVLKRNPFCNWSLNTIFIAYRAAALSIFCFSWCSSLLSISAKLALAFLAPPKLLLPPNCSMH